MEHYRIAVIDDDPFVIAHLKRSLCEKLPGVDVDGVRTPMAPAGYDVYIVDKDFEGACLGFDVINRVRDLAPDALVVAYSAFLDKEFLQSLLSERCSGAFDKGSLQELEDMIRLIGQFLDERGDVTPRRHGLRSTVDAISSLLREWNLRLESNRRDDTRRVRQ